MSDPETEIAVDVAVNPTVTFANKDGLVLLAFNKPTIGFVWNTEAAARFVKEVNRQIKLIRKQRHT